jgi:hypothetical protein
VNLTLLDTAAGVSGAGAGAGAGALMVAVDDVASLLVGSVIARSQAAAKPTKKMNERSLCGRILDVRWRKGRASNQAS